MSLTVGFVCKTMLRTCSVHKIEPATSFNVSLHSLVQWWLFKSKRQLTEKLSKQHLVLLNQNTRAHEQVEFLDPNYPAENWMPILAGNRFCFRRLWRVRWARGWRWDCASRTQWALEDPRVRSGTECQGLYVVEHFPLLHVSASSLICSSAHGHIGNAWSVQFTQTSARRAHIALRSHSSSPAVWIVLTLTESKR